MKTKRALLAACLWLPWASAALADTVIKKGQENWRYWDKAEDPGEKWAAAEFDDSKWDQGKAPLGYGEDDVATKIDFGGDEEDKNPAAFFRLKFQVADPKAFTHFVVRHRMDDGAVLALNGAEVARVRMADGPVSEKTFSSGKKAASDVNEGDYELLALKAESFKAGENVLAVSVHQSDAASSDLVLDLELLAMTDEQYKAFQEAESPKDIGGKVDQVIKAYEEEMKAFMAEYRKALTDEARQEMAKKAPKANKAISALTKLITSNPEHESVPGAIFWLARNDGNSPSAAMLQMVEKHHLNSDKLVDLIYLVSARNSGGEANSFLTTAKEKSTNKAVQAVASFGLAQGMTGTDDPAKRDELLSFAVENIGDAKAFGRSLRKTMEGSLFEIKNLQVGMKAPEIEGEDVEGVPFKLSDYRGKVIMLDFWGDW